MKKYNQIWEYKSLLTPFHPPIKSKYQSSWKTQSIKLFLIEYSSLTTTYHQPCPGEGGSCGAGIWGMPGQIAALRRPPWGGERVRTRGEEVAAWEGGRDRSGWRKHNHHNFTFVVWCRLGTTPQKKPWHGSETMWRRQTGRTVDRTAAPR